MNTVKTVYEITMVEHPNKTFEAKLEFEGAHFAGDECDTRRDALASLALAMGLQVEMRVLSVMAPDHNLNG